MNLHIGIGAFTNDDLTFREVPRQLQGHRIHRRFGRRDRQQHGFIATLLVSDIFDRFPRLQVVSVESGFGYLPFLLESLDWEWKNSSGPLQHPSRRCQARSS